MKTNHVFLASLLSMTFVIFSCDKQEPAAPELSQSDQTFPLAKKINPDFFAAEPYTKIEYDIQEAFTKQYLSVRESLRSRNQLNKSMGQEETDIYPTGQFPEDVINVQAVVDDAGERGVDLKLILKATNENGEPTPFNFDGYPVILRGSYWDNQTGNATIEGETLNGHRTTILKGYDTGLFGLPNDFKAFIVHDRGNVTFDNLKFDKGGIWNFGGPNVGPDNMLVENCIFLDYNHLAGALDNRGTQNSYTIRNNRFENVLRAFAMYNPNNQCIVEDNYFSSEEILFHKCVGNFEFKNNTVNAISVSNPNVFTNGLVLVLNYDANFIIQDNHFINDYTLYGSGIYIGPNSDETQFQISGNIIEIESTYYGGIDLEGYFFGTLIQNVCIFDNEIKGNAAWAISANNYSLLPPPSEISSITISENKLDGFESTCLGIDADTFLNVGCADIFLGGSTTDISVCAKNAVVVNYGVGNSISDDDADCPDCGNE